MELEVSMATLFPVCVDILREASIPLSPSDLMVRAFQKLGIHFPARVHKAAWEKNKENIREKFFQERWHGLTFYVGEPYCVGGLRAWFELPQLKLFQIDEVRIPGHATAGAHGAFDALMRLPHMLQKNPQASLETRNRACAQGKILEAHVQRYFRETYPTLYCPAGNEGQWHLPDRNDFYLLLGQRRLGIDVLGPAWDGTYHHAPLKRGTDIHLLCKIDGADCVLTGVRRGAALGDHMLPETSFSPVNFLVWLNCLRERVDYKVLTEMAGREKSVGLQHQHRIHPVPDTTDARGEERAQ